MNSSDNMQGSAMPRNEQSIQTATWSRKICRNQPRQRTMLSGVGKKTRPT
jgi:hypothetical protein